MAREALLWKNAQLGLLHPYKALWLSGREVGCSVAPGSADHPGRWVGREWHLPGTLKCGPKSV